MDEPADNVAPVTSAEDDGRDVVRERESFLARTCADDPSLRRRMARLLDRLAATRPTSEEHQIGDPAVPSTIRSVRPPAGRASAVVRRSVEPGTLIDGKYRLENRIGAGGMGVVYLARHVALDRRVAVKLLSNALVVDAVAIRRFEREAVVMARLKHPNIVTIYDFGVSTDAGAYFVMEMLEGVTLAHEIRQAGRLPVARATLIVGDICRAVEAAHDAGVIHRDLKPDNVFLERASGESDAVKVLDFGIAKLWATEDASESTNAGGFVGTPAYMSPEQCRDDVIDPRSDVYALGCVLFTCLTGRPPFVGGSVVSILARHVDAEPPRPSAFNPDLPAELDDVVLRALSKSPGERQSSAAEFGAEIRRATGVRLAVPPDQSVADLPLASGSTAKPRPRATNLPEPVTSFIGRADDLAALVASIESSRFVTLIGPGGIGKTRLAFEAGRAMMDRFDDGVFAVDLRPCVGTLGVARAVAAQFGVREEPDRPILETLGDALRDRTALVIADTCEHLVDAAGHVVEDLLGSAPRLRVVTTSREALNAEGETLFHVLPLDVPNMTRRDRGYDEILSTSAVQLFVERALRKRKGLDLTLENVRLIGKLCAKLDGIPLAIELAAARSNVMTIQQMVDRMDDRFALLTLGGSSGRQKTLRAIIDWSYGLLSETERELFAQLSVFEGGCTLEAIRHVCRLSATHMSDVHDVASALVDKSLAMLEEREGFARYRMLDTIREYADEKLRSSGGDADVRRRFFDWALEEAEITRSGITRGQDQKASLDRCEREHDNLSAALRWAIRARNDVREGLSLAAKLCHFWDMRAHALYGIEWFTEAQTAAEGDGPSSELASAMFGAGFLYSSTGADEKGLEQYDRSLAVSRQVGDRYAISRALIGRSEAQLFLGHSEQAEAGFRESLELQRQYAIGSEIDCVILEFYLGLVAFEREAYDEARELIGATLEAARRLNDGWRCALMLHNLGEIALRRHEIGEAAERFRESIVISEQIGYTRIMAYARIGLGLATGLDGNVESGHDLIAAGLEASYESGELRAVSFSLWAAATLAARQQRWRRAILLSAGAASMQARFGVRTTKGEYAFYDTYLCDARREAGAWVNEVERRGAELPLDEIVAVAMDPQADGTSSR